MPPELQRPPKPSWMQPNQTAGKRGLNFGKEIIDKTGKGMSMISSGIDAAAGLPGRIATGFNPNVPTGFSEQVGQATEGLTGNRTLGNIAGFAAGMAEPMGMPGKAGKVLEKAPNLSEKGYQTIIDYLDHTEGISKLSGDAAKALKYNAQVIAEKLGMDSTGGDMQLANKLRQHLDMQGTQRVQQALPQPVAQKLYHGGEIKGGLKLNSGTVDHISEAPFLSLTDNNFVAGKYGAGKFNIFEETKHGGKLNVLDASDFKVTHSPDSPVPDVQYTGSKLKGKDLQLAIDALSGLDRNHEKLLKAGFDGIKFPYALLTEEALPAGYRKANEIRIFNQDALKKLAPKVPGTRSLTP